MNFFEQMQNTQDRASNVSITENGAVGYKSTGKALLDINFAVSSLRSMEEEEITEMYSKAWDENPELALRWLFFLRDVREGLGERRSFRIIFKWLIKNHRDIAERLLDGWSEGDCIVSFYGRWDDLLAFYETSPVVLSTITTQLGIDERRMKAGKPISLLAKWLPSINTSSAETVRLAKTIAHDLGMTPKEYRKMLSKFRKYIDVVERKMSANEWSQIDYEKVPSKANLRYAAAFFKHDEARRAEYLKRVSKGEAKINAFVAYPYEIYDRMLGDAWFSRIITDESQIATLEAMWKSLLGDSRIDKNVIVVADGSGSMFTHVSPSTSATALSVAYSLALYFAELLPGEFHGKFITFSEHPQLVDVSGCSSLAEKIRETLKFNEVANTNVEAVFDLILQTAVDNHVDPKDLPETVLIISDMEFDTCTESNAGWGIPDSLFGQIGARYQQHGYQLPRLVFWNVCSRTMTIPVTENKLGVALVSGFSVNNMEMILSGEIDPYKCLVDMLNKSRYDLVVYTAFV